LFRGNVGENGDLLGGIPSLAGDIKPSGKSHLKTKMVPCNSSLE